MALKCWWEVFPQGTKAGDEETKFFCALSRHRDYKWRTVDSISEESGLSKTRVEELIGKYYEAGLIYQNLKNPDQWGYWERVGERKTDKDILEEEHENRLKKKS